MNNVADKYVYVLDDDEAVRDSIKELVESIGLPARIYGSPNAFLGAFQPQYSGCLVLDIRMAEMSGLTVQKKLMAMGVKIPVIFITGHGDVPMAVTAMQNGAMDFYQKPYRDQELLDSIIQAMEQGSVATARNLEKQLASLTKRELEVYEKLMDGSSSKKIAVELGVSPRTVDAHRHNLLQKLEFDSVKDLIVYCMAPDRNR